MKQKITFHIGLEKTGTRSFQRFCTEQSGLLKRYSVVYPTTSLAFGGVNHAPLVACYLNYYDFSIRSSGKSRSAVLHSLLDEIDEAKGSDILISAEHFSSRFQEREIARLAEDFSEFDCRIAVVVREHHARLCSAYDQSVRSGRGMTFEAYCDEVLHRENRYMRYATTIGSWESVFCRENISVYCHSSGQDIIPILCGALISPDLPLPTAKSYWDNLSIGPSATELLRRVNSGIGRVPGASHPLVSAALSPPRRGFTKLARKLNGEERRWQLSERNLARLNEIAADDNAWLAKHYGIRLDGLDQDASTKDRTEGTSGRSGSAIADAN